MKDFSYNLKNLHNDMQSEVSKWQRPAGSPTIPHMSSSVKGWVHSIENLSVYDESLHPSFMKAREQLVDAWENRDDRNASIKSVSIATRNLGDMIANAEDPQAQHVSRVRSVKAMFGDHIVEQHLDDPQLHKFYNIRTKVEAMKAASHPTWVAAKSIDNVREDIESMYDSLYGNPAKAALKSTATYLERMKENQYSKRNFDSYAFKASQAISDAAMTYFGTTHQTYTPSLTLSGGAFKSMQTLDQITEAFNRHNFYDPDSFIYHTMNRVKSIIDDLSNYDDYRAVRQAKGIYSSLAQAREATGGHRAIKSNIWENPHVHKYMEDALDRVAELQAYLKRETEY